MAQPVLAFQAQQEQVMMAKLVDAGFDTQTIAAAGGAGAFVQKLLDFMKAHPFLAQFLMGLINKWLTSTGLPTLPSPAHTNPSIP